MQLETKITHVIIYQRDANIIRTGRLMLEEGINAITIDGLPETLRSETLRIELASEEQVKLLNIEAETIHLTESPTAEIKTLEDEIEALEDEGHLIQLKNQTIDERIDHLDGLMKSPRTYAYGLSSGKINFETHTAWLDELTQQRNDLIEQKQAQNIKLRELKKKIEAKKSALGEINMPKKKSIARVLCRIDSPKAASCEIILSYDVHDGGWQPLYDFRLHENTLQIDLLAEVMQLTGEDWQDIHLSLSTAQPHEHAQLIELDPWYIHFRTPRFSGAAKALAADENSEMIAHSPQMRVPSPGQVVDQGTHVTYQLQQKVSVPSRKKPVKIPVGSISIPVTLDYQVAPRLETRVTRRIKGINESPFILLPGEVQLFDGARFIGSTRIDLTPKKADIEMPFGFDPRIMVEWKLVKREVEKQLLKDRRRIHFAYEASIHNLNPDPINLNLYDHLPVGTNEAINIKIDILSPQPDETTELNQYQWRLKLAPDEEQTIKIAFSVDFPRNKTIAGLD